MVVKIVQGSDMPSEASRAYEPSSSPRLKAGSMRNNDLRSNNAFKT